MSVQTIERPSALIEPSHKVFSFVTNNVKRVALVAALVLRGLSTVFYFISHRLMNNRTIKNIVGFERFCSIEDTLVDSGLTFFVGVNYLFDKAKFCAEEFENKAMYKDFKLGRLDFSDLLRIGFNSYSYKTEHNV